MGTRTRTAVALVTACAAAAAVALVSSDGSPTSRALRASASDRSPPGKPAGHAREDCSTRSEADFPGAFTSPRNVVAGPLVLVGGAHTDAATVREFGGNKFPLLVKAGHTVKVRISGRERGSAGLAYGPLPEGEIALGDTYRSVTFVACRPGTPAGRYRPDGPSGSHADGVAVTF